MSFRWNCVTIALLACTVLHSAHSSTPEAKAIYVGVFSEKDFEACTRAANKRFSRAELFAWTKLCSNENISPSAEPLARNVKPSAADKDRYLSADFFYEVFR